MTPTDWDLLARIVGPVLGAFVGWGLARVSERRSKLVTYYGHVSAFLLNPPPPPPPQPPPPPVPVFTHAVVIRNAGRKVAKDVRVSHNVLPPDFTIHPAVPHTVEQLQGGVDIVIAQLVPYEEVTINYLYGPPTTYDQITRGVRSEDGFAKVLTVLLTPQVSRRTIIAVWGLIALGAIAVTYFVVKLGVAAWVRFGP